MKIVIVNTGRFGDIIQSSPLIKSLKLKFPNSEIYYLCLENFKDAAYLIDEIDHVFSIDFSNILKNIDFLNLNVAYEEIKSKFDLNLKFNLLINLSFSHLSAIVSSLLIAEDKRGLILNDSNEYIVYDSWSKFFLSIVDYREYSPFNIVDIFSKIGGVSSKKNFVKESQFIDKVGFQLGASTDNRRWPVKYFASLAKLIIKEKKDIKIFLLGAKNEVKLGYEFEEYFNSENIINLIGKTNLKQLRDLLTTLDLLVTNDTGTMHLAWFCGKKVIELSLGPALFNTTGPYGNNHIIIQPEIFCSPCSYNTICPHLKCHSLVHPEDVLNLIFNKRNQICGEVNVFQTKYDNNGYLSYEKIFGRSDFPEKNKKLRKIWLKLIEGKNNFKITENKNLLELNELIDKILSIISVIQKEINIKKIEILWDKIKIIENLIRDKIFSDYKNFIVFYRYFDFSNKFYINDNLNSLIKNYKISLLKLKYAINNFS